MKITSAKFDRGVVGSTDFLDDKRPKIAFVGRSNVGKSSLINTITGVKKLAISSSQPGRTQQLNFFLINEDTFFIDLPGYGYAKTSLKHAEKMRRMIMWFFEDSGVKLKKVVVIIDALIGPTNHDRDMMDLLEENGHEYIIAANKVDKIKPSKRFAALRDLKKEFEGKILIPFSTETKEGKEELLAALD